MRTVGVDLAAEPASTAIAVLDWGRDTAELSEVAVGVDDRRIIGILGDGVHLGIDCPFGWPDEFIAFIVEHAAGGAATDAPGDMAWRRRLAYRETDRHVRERTGRWPLSVSTDRLGLTAMRCAGLLGGIEAAGIVVDRSGRGTVSEVYPGGALRLWGVRVDGYRTDSGRRDQMLARILEQAPWLELGGWRSELVRSADALDALVAALIARSAAMGRFESPPAEHLARARREGWVVLATDDLNSLIRAWGDSA